MKKKLLILSSIGLVVPFLAACNSSTLDTQIYIGNKQITVEGKQDSLGFNNIQYESSSNTLTISSAIFKYSKSGVKEYKDIYLGYDKGNLGDVSFLVSYEGTKELNIFIEGDISFINDNSSTTDCVGGIYIKNDAKVNLIGPGKIETTCINHSIIYGKNSNVSFDNIIVESANDICSFGIACNEGKFIDSTISLGVTTSGYSGLYIPNGSTNTRSKFYADGYSYGAYIGTSYYYDNCYVEFTGSNILAANYYGLVAYDTTFVIDSLSSGMFCYDGGTFNNCTGEINADLYYGISSLECTLIFNNSNFEIETATGIGIQAWRNIFYNSTIISTSLDGFGINSEFNAIVPEEENPGIYITNSDVVAKGTTGAIYSTGDFTIQESSLTNNQKMLSKHVEIYDKNINAICEETETELQLATTETSNKTYPTNGAKSVIITKNN